MATVIILLLDVVPHHHHNGMPCMASVNNKHTNHHGDNDIEESETCIAESFYISNMDNEVKCKVLSCNNCDHSIHATHIFPILYLVADFLLYPSEITYIKPEYGKYLSYRTSSGVSQFYGLRAPPFC